MRQSALPRCSHPLLFHAACCTLLLAALAPLLLPSRSALPFAVLLPLTLVMLHPLRNNWPPSLLLGARCGVGVPHFATPGDSVRVSGWNQLSQFHTVSGQHAASLCCRVYPKHWSPRQLQSLQRGNQPGARHHGFGLPYAMVCVWEAKRRGLTAFSQGLASLGRLWEARQLRRSNSGSGL